MLANHCENKPVPLCRAVPYTNPASLLSALEDQPYLSFLDSAAPHRQRGRYSFLAFAPFAIFRVSNGCAFWNDEALNDPPFVALQRLMERYALSPAGQDLPPFQGGAMGYLSYEAGRLLEKLPQTSREDEKPDEILLPFYDLVLAIDLYGDQMDAGHSARAWAFSSGWPKYANERDEHAKQRLDWFCNRLKEAQALKSATHKTGQTPSPIPGWRSELSRSNFEKSIEKAKEYIRQGDIFQANITQRFSAQIPACSNASPLGYYQAMRHHNAAPFAAYLRFADLEIASSSPERFVTLTPNGEVETRPIKGTAPRDLENPANDQALAEALLASEKDRAENIMITDLMRNDLSRVCEPGSIKVPDLCALESYSRVHHLVSTITGKLKQNNGPVALLCASFPGGSITGAPKIRAMEIISELEDLPRGIYCGSIGYLGFDGAMDTSIAIRTATFRNGTVHFNVGGGITTLSDPAEEYEECLHKATALFRAFGTSLEAERAALEAGPEENFEEGMGSGA
nr:aminodeoxychorismate synthase component I [uncultured Cohaesibacter sp.]